MKKWFRENVLNDLHWLPTYAEACLFGVLFIGIPLVLREADTRPYFLPNDLDQWAGKTMIRLCGGGMIAVAVAWLMFMVGTWRIRRKASGKGLTMVNLGREAMGIRETLKEDGKLVLIFAVVALIVSAAWGGATAEDEKIEARLKAAGVANEIIYPGYQKKHSLPSGVSPNE
jgi:hypothetical protein